MPEVGVTLRSVDGDRSDFVWLLLEADDAESIVRSYLNDGELYELLASGLPIGVVLLTAPGPVAIEIKNIALRREYRGQGLGRAAIGCIVSHARAREAVRLLVGTADSGVSTIAFYRACGFHDAGRIEGFFDRYPEPVVEDGVQAHDMVRFEMTL